MQDKTIEEIEDGHEFTVLATTYSQDDIVEVGDKQIWCMPTDTKPGKLFVKRDMAFWDDKCFLKDPKEPNVFNAHYVEDGTHFVIRLHFERGRHFTEHSSVWMIFGSRSLADENGVCGPEDGPPQWGGQNKQ